MVEYKDGRGNTSRGRGGMPFRGHGSSIVAKFFFIVVRIILKNVLIAFELFTLSTNVGSCMANFLDLLELLICLLLLDHDFNTRGTSVDEYVTLSKSV